MTPLDPRLTSVEVMVCPECELPVELDYREVCREFDHVVAVDAEKRRYVAVDAIVALLRKADSGKYRDVAFLTAIDLIEREFGA